MKIPPAFQFYADDFLAGTLGMTAEEVGCYIRLLCVQWSKGELPDDPEMLKRYGGAMASPYVLSKFKKVGTVLKNLRLEEEREKQAAYRKNRSESGTSGAIKRWRSHGTAIQQPMAKDSSPSPSSSSTPTIREVFDAWNSEASLCKCLLVSDKRRMKLQRRLKDGFFTENWRRAITLTAKSAFCCGDNDRGWKATFDWFIQPDTCAKIIEGVYNNRSNSNGNRTKSGSANPRNDGVIRDNTDYAEVSRRKQQKQLQLENAQRNGQMARPLDQATAQSRAIPPAGTAA